MFDPIRAAREIKASYIDYITTTFDLADPDYAKALRRELQGESLTIVLNFSDRPAQSPLRGTLVRSSCPRRSFNGSLQPWEAVILEEEGVYDESAGV